MNAKSRRGRRITHFFEGLGISLGRLILIAQWPGRYRPIRLFKHPELGKVFVLGDEIQHVEAWAPLYHEPLVHLPAAFIPQIKQVAILGGGTLFAAAEALKYQSVERVLVVDQDKQVAHSARRYYSHAQRCFADRRFEFLEGDIYRTLPQLRNRFDLIINDGADLLTRLLRSTRSSEGGDPFLLMKRALTPQGVCADVVYRHVFERTRTLQTFKFLSGRSRLALSLVFLPEYHGVLHLLCLWGKRSSAVSQNALQPKNQEQRCWQQDIARCPCDYYDPRFLSYYLYLPNGIKKSLGIKRRAA